jgi:hypothetical protein
MNQHDTLFHAPESFGLKVLLKLTKKHAGGIEILTSGNRIRSNVSFKVLCKAVEETLKAHNIKLVT